jgi:hypothetical protein
MHAAALDGAAATEETNERRRVQTGRLLGDTTHSRGKNEEQRTDDLSLVWVCVLTNKRKSTSANHRERVHQVSAEGIS